MAVSVIPFVFPGISGVRCFFQFLAAPAHSFADNISLSVGDDPDAAAHNRTALSAACGTDALAEVHQVHGDVTIFEPQPVPAGINPAQEADGLATSRSGLGLLIKTADCQPILLAHVSGRYVAALHVGWRGNRIGYPTTGAQAFCAHYGLDPADVAAVRGPSLGPAAAQFVNFDQEWSPDFLPWFDPQTRTMDLWALTRHQLQAAGLRAERIFGLDLCTYSLSEAFFSYRRDRHCGRQGSVIRRD